jgi:hypothetical protein
MKISDIADVSLGTILTRVKPAFQFDDFKTVTIVSMQEINYLSGGNIDVIPEKISVPIATSKISQCTYAKETDILYGLTLFRAAVVKDDLIGKLVPSNLAILKIKRQDIDPGYLMWVLNNGPCSKNSISYMIQGSTFVKMLNIATLRELDIGPTPPLEVQKEMAILYQATLKRERIENTIKNKKTKLIMDILNKTEKGE